MKKTFWENFVLAMLSAAETTVPLFIHSQHGLIVLNASENVVNSLANSLTPAAPAPVAPVSNPNAAPVPPANLQAATPAGQ
jgi:hypothetical protein